MSRGGNKSAVAASNRRLEVKALLVTLRCDAIASARHWIQGTLFLSVSKHEEAPRVTSKVAERMRSRRPCYRTIVNRPVRVVLVR